MDYGINIENLDNNIKLFRIYKKLSSDEKKELTLLLTAENIMGVKSVTKEVNEQLESIFNRVDKLSIVKLTDYHDEENNSYWTDKYYFKNIMDQVKVYLMLRPNIIEKYPELLL